MACLDIAKSADELFASTSCGNKLQTIGVSVVSLVFTIYLQLVLFVDLQNTKSRMTNQNSLLYSKVLQFREVSGWKFSPCGWPSGLRRWF